MYDYANRYSRQDLIESLKDLTKRSNGKNAYILIADGQVRADTAKYEITKHLESDEAITKPGEDVEIECLYGLVLDPAVLPQDIPKDIAEKKDIYLLIDMGTGFDLEVMDSMEEVAESVSALLQINEDLTIDDFAIIIGEKIPLAYTLAKAGDSVPVHRIMGT